MRGGFVILVAAAVAAIFAAGPARAQGVPVDLELAFVVDASGSIDEAETRLQRQGYAAAILKKLIVEIAVAPASQPVTR